MIVCGIYCRVVANLVLLFMLKYVKFVAPVLDESLPLSSIKLDLYQHDNLYVDQKRVARHLTVASNVTQMTPLFQGLGTHFSYIYVGTPPQRVSVIIDTGSHLTAFPCVGCACGKHMDPYFDPTKSSTSRVPSCSGKKRCYFSQAYR